MDVCAHEIAHGICGTTARLKYQGESGAINEGLSDIWAACVEHWATSNKQTWQIGEDISLLGIPFRSMANPNASLSGQPDTYSGTYWVNPSSSTDKGGVHTNSGVANYWFYLVSQGASGTNDLGSTYSVSGIGINSAASIVYQTERWKIPSNVEQEISFTQFREASISASTDLFGVNSCQTMAVTNAWYAVGVGGSFQYTNVSVSGSTAVCSSGATFTVSNLPSGCNISWDKSDNLNLASTSGNSATFTVNWNGSGWVQATISSGCGDITLPQKQVVVGTPLLGFISFTNLVGGQGYWCSSHYGNTFEVETNDPSASYEARLLSWPNFSLVRSNAWASPGSDPFGYAPQGWYVFGLKATNGCGTSDWFETEVEYTDCNGSGEDPESFGLLISPNPTSGDLDVTIVDEKPEVQALSRSEKVQYVLYDLNRAQAIKSWHFNTYQTQQRLNVHGFKAGQYILVVTKGKFRQSTHIIIK